MALRLLAWDDSTSRMKRTTADPSSISGSKRAGLVSVSLSATSIAVTYSSAMPDSNYAVTCNLVNTADVAPQYQPITITAYNTTGFTAKWNAPLDTANYSLAYQAGSFV